MEDRRALRTKRAIREAFISLATQKEVNKITVSELSKIADLGRGTFYLHYKDIYDLQESLENEVLADLAMMSEDVYTNKGVLELQPLLESTTNYIWNNKDIFGFLLSAKGSVVFLEHFKQFVKDKIMVDKQDIESLYAISYVISGTLGIIQEWVAGGFTTPPKELASIMKNIIKGDQ